MLKLSTARPNTRWLWLLASPLIGLLVAELALRAGGVRPPERPTRRGSLLEAGSQYGLKRIPRADGWAETLYPARAGEVPRVVRMSSNTQRLRGPLVVTPKPPGTLRVACIGDSHTFGDGVLAEEAWPAHLEGLLREHRHPEWVGKRIEVLNCGVNAYNAADELLWLERYVLPTFQPDIVLWQYFVNDTNAPGNPRQRDRWLEWTAPHRPGWLGALRSRSRLADVLCDAIQRRRGLARYVELRSGGYEDESPGWQSVTTTLRAAYALFDERDVEFAVLLFPFLMQRGETLASHHSLAKVRAFCEASGVPCFDGEPVFHEAIDQLDSLRVSPHDYHANGRAYALFAAELATWLAGDP